jgi:hypothetical protein
MVDLCVYSNEPSGFINVGIFFNSRATVSSIIKSMGHRPNYTNIRSSSSYKLSFISSLLPSLGPVYPGQLYNTSDLIYKILSLRKSA